MKTRMMCKVDPADNGTESGCSSQVAEVRRGIERGRKRGYGFCECESVLERVCVCAREKYASFLVKSA